MNIINKTVNKVLSFFFWKYRLAFKPFYINMRMKSLSRKVKELKAFHKGESCFIIGNGPSLTVEDLNRIKNQVSFSCNRINILLDKTEWKPYYYTFTDSLIASEFFEELYVMRKKQMFVVVSNTSYNSLKKHLGKKNCIYLRSYYGREDNGFPKFSTDVSKKLFQHGTVTYANIQLAAYMGFENIYLLGVDHDFGMTKLKNGAVEVNKQLLGNDHFSKEYNSVNYAPAKKYEMTEAYLSAKKYCDNVGVKIYNATRGGKLEVFQRVNFDELFDSNGNFIGYLEEKVKPTVNSQLN
ncbi:6-hydroxymethylpterin diphosphokinase MptE-like protein [Bacillus sp. JJ1533]|uniref:6-hydroxymethylpterin diphosphokinase MptE-like protein n=1 Tax=Bacillus sp. JJ1533 TaxID=3122959 RepID=UPI002FFFE323